MSYFQEPRTYSKASLSVVVPIKKNMYYLSLIRLESLSILVRERELGVSKLGWHGNFDTGFEKNTFISPLKSRKRGFFFFLFFF